VSIIIRKNELKNVIKEILEYIFNIDEYKTLSVDILGSESTVADEIDTSAESTPKTVFTPPEGKKISTRNVFLASDSDSGEVECRFKDSNKLICKIYCSKFKYAQLSNTKIDGEVGEPIIITWSGLSSGAKIFYSIRYKLISG